MAYDEEIADRMRAALDGHPGITEKRMFGGICFLLDGNMLAGPVNDVVMFRVGPDAYEAALQRPEARELSFTVRAMRVGRLRRSSRRGRPPRSRRCGCGRSASCDGSPGPSSCPRS